MAKHFYNLYEAKTFLSSLVDRAAAGEEIVIGKAGLPLARLCSIELGAVPRQPGGWEGKVTISEDFDAPLPPELLKAFEGEE